MKRHHVQSFALDDPRVIGFTGPSRRTPQRADPGLRTDRCAARIHGGNGRCPLPATRDGMCQRCDQERRRSRALVAIVLTDDTNHDIARAVGLDVAEIQRLRDEWRRQRRGTP